MSIFAPRQLKVVARDFGLTNSEMIRLMASVGYPGLVHNKTLTEDQIVAAHQKLLADRKTEAEEPQVDLTEPAESMVEAIPTLDNDNELDDYVARPAADIAEELGITVEHVLALGQVRGVGSPSTLVDPETVRIAFAAQQYVVADPSAPVGTVQVAEDVVRKSVSTTAEMPTQRDDRPKVAALYGVIREFLPLAYGDAPFRPETREVSKGRVTMVEYDSPLRAGWTIQITPEADTKLQMNPKQSYPLLTDSQLNVLKAELSKLSFVPFKCQACRQQLDQHLTDKIHKLLRGDYILRGREGATKKLLSKLGRETNVPSMKFKRKHPECVEILGVAREVVLRFVEEGQDFKDDITTSDFLSALQGSISQLYFEMMSDPEQRYRFRHVTVDIMRKRVHDIVDVLLEEAGIA